MSDLWFTSDTHFGHRSILHLGNGRPFATVEEHDQAIIERWNERVKPGDTIYHLGDFSFSGVQYTREVIEQLNGIKHFAWGNHDHKMDRQLSAFAENFQYKEIVVGDQRIVLFHYPIQSWHQVGRGSWHLHGHCHGNLPVTDMARMDVGVDTHDFAPWHIDEVAEVLNARTGLPGDHHV